MRPAETSAAAKIAGCLVTQVIDASGVPTVHLECPSGWAAARFLVALAHADVYADEVVGPMARRFRERLFDDETYARAIHAWMIRNVAFERERGEIFQSPATTCERRKGDCDCHARMVFALLVAGGVPARFVFLHRGGSPAHVVVQALIRGKWQWLETTVQRGGGARFGEHPIAAAKRVGVIRADVRAGMKEVAMGGSIGVEGGATYRMRVGVLAPRDAASEQAIEDGLRQLGFTDVTVWFSRDALPADFPPNARDDMPEADWTAFAEALYARPESRVVEMPIQVPADAREGLIVIALDDLTEVSRIEPTTGVHPVVTMGDVAIKETGDLSSGFFVKLKDIAARRGFNAEHALKVMFSESRIKSTSIHPSAPASGIFGRMFRTRDEAVAFTKLSAEDQLPAYEAFMAPYKGWVLPLAGNLYQVNFLPASVKLRGTHPGAVLAARDGTGYNGQEAGFYRDNAILDVDRDGKITVQDLENMLTNVTRGSARFAEALARLRAAPVPSSWGGVVALLPWLALGGAIWYTIRSS